MPNERPPELKQILDGETFLFFTREMELKAEFYQVVGLFITNFGHAETQLDAVLGELEGVSNYEDVRKKIKGMTVFQKGEAILSKSENEKRLGEAFTLRMKHFHDAVRKVRNDLAHGMLASQSADIIVGNIGAPWDEKDETRWPNSNPQPKRDYDLVLRMAAWLRQFQDDADEIANELRKRPTRIVDLKAPKSAPSSEKL